MSIVGLRDLVGHAIEQRTYARASAMLAQLLREEPTASNASYVVSCFEKLRPQLELKPCRVALLRSFVIEPLIPFLRARCFTAGIDAAVHVGTFNAYAQDLLDAESPLYRFAPDIAILAVRTADVSPALWDRASDLGGEEIHQVVESTLADFRLWIQAFRRHSQAHLIVQTLELPPFSARGVLDSQQAVGQKEALYRINQGLQRLAQENPGTYVLDYDALVARYGRLRWHDQHRALTIRMPIVADGLLHLADEYMRFIRPLTGKICKALVVDLDNTLWGGVVGEEGLEGIQLSVDYPGSAYQAVQRAILDLSRRGIILAICSKNNEDDALAALATHSGMVLRPEHFAAVKINWDDKVENLRRIADELEIGLDAIAFLDDSPAEREAVRSELPEVVVFDLPADPGFFGQTLRECPVFERLVLSSEDQNRGRYYAEQRQRRELHRSSDSLEEFYVSLQMRAEICTGDRSTLARIAQLTQKTNQFNLTTRRRSEQELAQLAADPHVRILSMRFTDRFGDYGLVGAAISRRNGDECEIDTLLLSCRAIGRTAETALLACLAAQARREGATRLMGSYLPTKKNVVAKDFYARHGFALANEEAGGSRWEFDLTRGDIIVPPWIECVQSLGAP